MAKEIDTRIDALYQLPLDEFTAARNALAKEAGKDAPAIKQLTKPPVAAWAVNQLYWERRDDYEALVAAAGEMQRTHRAVIEGKKGDLRAATREHDRAIEIALKSTLALMKERGQVVTDVTRQAILNTLRALPSADPPGRLAAVLSPGGFEMLAGVKATKAAKATKETKETKGTKGTKTEETKVTPTGRADRGATDKAARDAAKQKAQRDAAERAIRDAEHEAKRMEFESARAIREEARAAKQLELARAAVDRARESLETAEREATAAQRAADAAVRARESAERKARDAASRIATLRAEVSGSD